MINAGDTAFILLSAALVMLMTPGLAFFYGGMVRSKNVLGTIMQSFIIIGLVTIIWVIYGYSLSFGPDVGHLIGNLQWFGLKEVGLLPNKDYAGTIPHLAFMIYQAMFAIITPALITGAFAERMKFSAFLAFIALWSTLVYMPIAHWVWGVGGWIRNLGALDFAGGNRRAHQLRHCCPGSRPGHGQAKGLWGGADDAPQPPPHHHWSWHALVWLVWIQCRIGPYRRGPEHKRLRGDPHRRRHGGPGLGHRGVDAPGQPHHPGGCQRLHCGPGSHYAGLGICGSHGRHPHRPRRRDLLLLGHRAEVEVRL